MTIVLNQNLTGPLNTCRGNKQLLMSLVEDCIVEPSFYTDTSVPIQYPCDVWFDESFVDPERLTVKDVSVSENLNGIGGSVVADYPVTLDQKITASDPRPMQFDGVVRYEASFQVDYNGVVVEPSVVVYPVVE